ncbi:phage tail protein [Algoriphagus yeomjeoni]|uniref:Microcystin-dependent protein n=1 Tax=Algoriphagus yeomjeoni TaxID=291403 RepID=A0A327P7R8_9BACT|nr:tail fiber protein [Algoriphagus yeomjeoni]RAI88309.1 microcystin-dependent protein [Algoriphagus yeomjeoni]
MDELLATIKLFAGNFAPRGFMLCQGQILPISQYTALFSLLGTTYGGDGRTTFALPNLSSRAPIGQGQGPGLSRINLGQAGGAEQITLTIPNLPNHTHPVNVSSSDGTTNVPTDKVLASTSVVVERGGDAVPVLSYGSTPNAQLAATALGSTGGNIPVQLRNPFLGLNYIICVQGIFPSRN